MSGREPVERLMVDLAARIGRGRYREVCCALLAGAPREEHVDELRALTGFAWQPGDDVFDHRKWRDHWVRTWGARGLLHLWDDAATHAIVRGLGDTHYRPAEMCLKVATRHDVAGSADGAARLARHELPRVRVAALRCLAVTGDTEHLPVVVAALDDDDPEVRRQADRARSAMRVRLDLVNALNADPPITRPGTGGRPRG